MPDERPIHEAAGGLLAPVREAAAPHWLSIRRHGTTHHAFVGEDGRLRKGPRPLLGALASDLDPHDEVWHHPVGYTPPGHDAHHDYDAPRRVPTLGRRATRRALDTLVDTALARQGAGSHRVDDLARRGSSALLELLRVRPGGDAGAHAVTLERAQAATHLAHSLADQGLTEEQCLGALAVLYQHSLPPSGDQPRPGRPVSPYEAATRRLLDQWALGPYPRDDRTLALHLAARDLFGSPAWKECPPWVRPRLWDRATAAVAEASVAAVVPSYLRGQYSWTQDVLGSIGATRVILYRPVPAVRDPRILAALRPAARGSDWAAGLVLPAGTARTAPLCSWTVDHDVACDRTGPAGDPRAWAERGVNVLALQVVPAAQVVATCRSGWGALPLSEVVSVYRPGSLRLVAASDPARLAQAVESIVEGARGPYKDLGLL